MARVIVPRGQQEAVRREYPKPAYTRILSFRMYVPGDGKYYMMCTQSLGQTIWLLKVQIWVLPKIINVNQGTSFSVHTGTVKPKNVEDVQKWERIMPLIDETGGLRVWPLHDGRDKIAWDVMKLYTGQPRRFAVIGMRGPGFGEDLLYTSFTISEG